MRSWTASEAAPPSIVAGERVTGVETLDGVKLLLGGRGWILHRLSGTEPVLRIYAEHEDAAAVAASSRRDRRRSRVGEPLTPGDSVRVLS